MDLDSVDRLRTRLRERQPSWFKAVTTVGAFAIALGVVSWLLGWWFGWSEFSYMAAGFATAFVAAVGFTFGKTELEVDLRMLPSRVTVGDEATVAVEVKNVSSRRMLPVNLEVPIGRNVARLAVPSLGSGEDWEGTLVVPTSRRAVIGVGPVTSVRGDPLRLFRRAVTWTDAQELFVHPRTESLNRLAAGWMRDLEGELTKDISNSDLNFHALRTYVRGDDRRHIHWRSSARLGEWVVRQFVDTRRSHLALLLSTLPADYRDAGEFELAVSIVASLGLRAKMDGQSVTLIAGDHQLPAPTGRAFMDSCSRIELGASTASLREVAMFARKPAAQASIAVVAAGSGCSATDLRMAADQMAKNARAMGVRANLVATERLSVAGGMSLIEAGSLEQFARTMWTVSA